MAWRIEVAPEARPTLRDWDPSLRAELIEQVAGIAHDPLTHLRRAQPTLEPVDTRVLEYRSEVIEGLTVRAFFKLDDVADRRLKLVALGHSATAGDEEAD